jgi:hypothetical protein
MSSARDLLCRHGLEAVIETGGDSVRPAAETSPDVDRRDRPERLELLLRLPGIAEAPTRGRELLVGAGSPRPRRIVAPLARRPARAREEGRIDRGRADRARVRAGAGDASRPGRLRLRDRFGRGARLRSTSGTSGGRAHARWIRELAPDPERTSTTSAPPSQPPAARRGRHRAPPILEALVEWARGPLSRSAGPTATRRRRSGKSIGSCAGPRNWN